VAYASACALTSKRTVQRKRQMTGHRPNVGSPGKRRKKGRTS
jgi:hypothetical protein